MSIFYSSLQKTDDYPWIMITKIYRADYESEAKENATRDWEQNYKSKGYRMHFHSIPYFDEFNGFVLSEVRK